MYSQKFLLITFMVCFVLVAIESNIVDDLSNTANKVDNLLNKTANTAENVLNKTVKLVTSPRTAINYLTKYGYADKNVDLESRSGAVDMVDFLKKFQNFFGLKTTGQLDPDTISVMNMPRCGVPDFFQENKNNPAAGLLRRVRRYKLQGSSWPQNTVSWHISKYSQRKDMKNKQRETYRSLEAALQSWSAASQLQFVVGTSGKKVDIDIRFEKGNHNDSSNFDGHGGTLAHAFFPQYGGDAHFDDDEEWTFDDVHEGTHLQSVALHEFGHSLGLSHSNVKGSVMFPTYAGVKTQLTADDRSAIQALYGAPSVATKPSGATSKPATTATYRPTGTNNGIPDLCQNFHIDAAFCAKRHDCYFLSGQYIWRLDPAGGVMSGYPKLISEVFKSISGPIESVFKYDDNFYVFKGNKVYQFPSLHQAPTLLLSLTDLFPGINVRSVDAVYQKERTGNIYIFKDGFYWRFHTRNGFHAGYPKSVNSWDGLPNHIDAILDWDADTTYFISQKNYWSYNERKNMMHPGYPKSASRLWLTCYSRSRRNRLATAARGFFGRFPG